MTQATGSRTSIYVAMEDNFNQLAGTTSPSGSAFGTNRLAIEVPYRSESLKAEQNLISSEVITSSRNARKPTRGNINAGGNLVLELNPHQYWLWANALGVRATVDSIPASITENSGTLGTPPYVHTFSVGDLPTSFSLEKRFGSFNSGNKYWQYTGCRISKLSITVPREGAVLATADILCANETPAAASMNTNVLYDKAFEHSAWDSFELLPAQVLLGATIGTASANALISELSFTISNPMDEDVRVLGGAGIRKSLPEGVVMVDGSATFMFTADTLGLAADISSGTVKAMQFKFIRGVGDGTPGDEYITFQLPELMFARNSPQVTRPTGIYVTYNFTGFYLSSSEASTFKVILARNEPPRL
ncbi:MAG: phage tail tube protein [bacterium]|nr:phage tail tube protein [bacterium]